MGGIVAPAGHCRARRRAATAGEVKHRARHWQWWGGWRKGAGHVCLARAPDAVCVCVSKDKGKSG